MNRKLSYEGKELHEMTQEELKNCCNLCYNHFDKLQFVEGSSYLYNELIAFSGLDEQDIKNYFLVAQYIKCKEKFKKDS